MNGLTKVDTVALKEKKKPKTKMAINRFETVNCLRKKNCRRKKKKKNSIITKRATLVLFVNLFVILKLMTK